MNEKRTGAAIVALFAFMVAASALRNGFALDDVHIILVDFQNLIHIPEINTYTSIRS